MDKWLVFIIRSALSACSELHKGQEYIGVWQHLVAGTSFNITLEVERYGTHFNVKKLHNGKTQGFRALMHNGALEVSDYDQLPPDAMVLNRKSGRLFYEGLEFTKQQVQR